MRTSSRGRSASDQQPVHGRRVSRRTLLRGTGAAVASGALAGCLSAEGPFAYDTAAEGTRLGLADGVPENVGYSADPTIESVSFQETGSVGPIPVNADVTGYAVEYEDTEIEEVLDSDAGGEVGYHTFLSIPQVNVRRWSIAGVAQWSVLELWRSRPDLLGQMGNFTIADDLDELAAEEVADAERARWFGERDAYFTDTIGRGFQLAGQDSVDAMGTELTPEDLIFGFMPVIQEQDLHAYYAIGTKTTFESTGDAIFSVYIGGRTVITDFVSDEFGPSTSGYKLVAEEHIPDPVPDSKRFQFGLFSNAQIETYTSRFVDAMTAEHASVSS